jgi:hypothetical protein
LFFCFQVQAESASANSALFQRAESEPTQTRPGKQANFNIFVLFNYSFWNMSAIASNKKLILITDFPNNILL